MLARIAATTTTCQGKRPRPFLHGSSQNVNGRWLPQVSSSSLSTPLRPSNTIRSLSVLSLSSSSLRRTSTSQTTLDDSCSLTSLPLAASSIHSYNNNNTVHNPFFQQTRWKRKDGNKYFMQERPPTKKQRKKYNRQLKQAAAETEKHGAPGSKAGARREWARQWKQDLLEEPNIPEPSLQQLEDKYTIDDALLDDLIGNTSDAQPTPEPRYLGHLHKKYFNRVADQMEDYRAHVKLLAAAADEKNHNTADQQALILNNTKDVPALPSDRDLSLALRAFRDQQGTRRKPIGIVRALSHLLQDVGVPVTALGEMTYTTLLTCAQTPTEGRRIIQMMKQQQHPVSAYSWSILVDIYAKVGDYKGCLQVHREMIAEGGMAPTLASFTSLLAACYRVCSDGRVAHKLRAEAGDTAWEQWQEMRIIGVDPDVMAYGAILRIMAARGKPERAINILEEMQASQVAPTTLCFTSALRAVAKSHATAIRYEHGWTRRNLRREFITHHHGKLAQSIVRLAESAEVEQDAGFVSALIGCAAAAGDLATAKAIYVAHQIRQLDQFRTVGSDDHLARLRGDGAEGENQDMLEWNPELLSDGSSTQLAQSAAGTSDKLTTKRSKNPKHKSFGEREYGKDSRILSAIMQACANAAGKDMIGSMWQGRENEGYLCENSLRLLNTPHVPSYHDDSIPGAGRTDNLTWAGDDKDLGRRGDNNKRLSKKFTGVYEDDHTPMTLDELDEEFSQYFVDKEGRRLPEYKKATPEDLWRERYGSKSGVNEAYDGRSSDEYRQEEIKAIATGEPRIAPMHFNLDTMRWEPGQAKMIEQPKIQKPLKVDNTRGASKAEAEEELYFDSDTMKWKTRPKTQSSILTGETVVDRTVTKDSGRPDREESKIDQPEELYFDKDERRWKVKETSFVETDPKFQTEIATSGQPKLTATVELSEDEFQAFFNEVKHEVVASGADPADIDEEEVRELFAAMQDEMAELSGEEGEDDEDDEAFMEKLSGGGNRASGVTTTSSDDQTITAHLAAPGSKTTTTLDFDRVDQMDDEELLSDDGIDRLTDEIHAKASLQDTAPYFEETLEVVDEVADADLDELRALLPAFSENRLRRVQKAFAKNLGDPSILDLVKISREIMPDYVTNPWLKQMSAITARYVMQQAIRDGVLDVHMLNGVLQLETSMGRLDRALDFHQSEFAKQRIQPTGYSDRLVLQMFLQNRRFSRAVSFKELVEKDGRTLDLQSYGSLIDFCAKRGQVGSAMLLLQECGRKHRGAYPGHAHLAALRIAYRKQAGLDEKDLEEMIGPDPIQWLKHGERHLKREMSKKGRRDVQFAQNARLRI